MSMHFHVPIQKCPIPGMHFHVRPLLSEGGFEIANLSLDYRYPPGVFRPQAARLKSRHICLWFILFSS